MLNFLEVLAGLSASRTCSVLQLPPGCMVGWSGISGSIAAPPLPSGHPDSNHGSGENRGGTLRTMSLGDWRRGWTFVAWIQSAGFDVPGPGFSSQSLTRVTRVHQMECNFSGLSLSDGALLVWPWRIQGLWVIKDVFVSQGAGRQGGGIAPAQPRTWRGGGEEGEGKREGGSEERGEQDGGENLARSHFRTTNSQQKVGKPKQGDCKDRFFSPSS
ncbi:unnamed protein product [Pleuronectes platessa]|uniref:Uncharacterized protein n=1 Tax=Pleuronectes platessa TaxID=8262 RepID=A0A9N7TUC8_PLEPL|nr:unnamed protein product [Pleuronectes platessa]